MKVIKLLLFLTVIVICDACRSDEFTEEPGTNPLITDLPISITGNLTGIVLDEDQQAISDAVIELDGLTTTTDENGVFHYNEAIALSTGSLVSISKEGYYEGFKFTRFEHGQNSVLKVQLVRKKTINSFQSSDEATVDVNGAQLYLPANITTHSDGSPYSGVVNVKAHWYDPTDEHTIAAMPGDLRGIDAEGLAVQLTTYGMMAVELSDDSGQELILEDGRTARLIFPLPENANGPDQIPMWHLDEQTGVWIEEGIANKLGAAMVAEVSHFSFWNCDDPFEIINLKGRIVSGLGEDPISGLQVVITDTDQMISGYGYTDNNGVFSGFVPRDNNLTMSLFICDELQPFRDLGILTEDTELGNISVDRGNQLQLTATLVDCNGSPLEEGFAVISTETTTDLVVANSGQINHSLFPCAAVEGTFRGYTSDFSSFSEALSFDLTEPFVDLEEVEVCDGQAGEFLSFSFIGEPAVTLTDVTVSIVDERFLHIYAIEPVVFNPFSIGFLYYLDGVPRDRGAQNNHSYSKGGGGYKAEEKDDPDWINVSGFEVGDVVSGVRPPINNGLNTLSFNLKIDQIIKSSIVSGHVWIDSDGDGIREPNENDPLPEDIQIRSYQDTLGIGLFTIDSYYEYTEIDADGSYVVSGLKSNIEYVLIAYDSEQSKLTSLQEGNDPTIDNDFFNNNNNTGNRTASFILGAEEVLPNIGLGLLK